MLGTGATDFRALHAKPVHLPLLLVICAHREVYMTLLFVLAMQDTMHPTQSLVLNASYVHCKLLKPMHATLVGQQILFYVNAIQDTMEMVRIAGRVSSAVPMQP